MSSYLDIILLLAVVVMIFMRLRNVLGTRPDEQPQIKIISSEEFDEIRRSYESEDKTQTDDISFDESSPTDKVLASIPNFSKTDFIKRCSTAFEMILKAFAAADEKTLKMLLTQKLFTKFQDIIKQRQEEGISAETDLIRLENVSIENAQISSKGIAQIVVKFISEQVNLLKNAAGEVIEGDENFVQEITDVWTFERDMNANSMIWFLASTKKGNA